MYEPVYSDGGDAICVMDQVSDTRNTDETWTDRIALKEAMTRLDDRERRILSLRFYEGKTQMEVSRGGRHLPGSGEPAGEGRHQHHQKKYMSRRGRETGPAVFTSQRLLLSPSVRAR